MIGRWTGAIPVFDLNARMKTILMVIVPIVAFGVVIVLNMIANKNMSHLYYYILCVLVLVAAFL